MSTEAVPYAFVIAKYYVLINLQWSHVKFLPGYCDLCKPISAGSLR
jgi:hypothetical protein